MDATREFGDEVSLLYVVDADTMAAMSGPTGLLGRSSGSPEEVLARDGDRSRLGPRSLGQHTRFVVDHAPCRVLLVWPDETPGLSTMPPPPHHPPHH